MGCTQSKSTLVAESTGKAAVPSAKGSPSPNPVNEAVDLTATRTVSSDDVEGSKETHESSAEEEPTSMAESETSSDNKDLVSEVSPGKGSPIEEGTAVNTKDITEDEPAKEAESPETPTGVEESPEPINTTPEDQPEVEVSPAAEETHQVNISENNSIEVTPIKTFSPSMEKKCAGCDALETESGKFKFCARCKVVCYCGRDCQIKHWKDHKTICNTLVTEATNLELMAAWGLSPYSCSSRSDKLNESTSSSVHDDAVRELEAVLKRLRSEDLDFEDEGEEPTEAVVSDPNESVEAVDPIEDAREAAEMEASDENTAPAPIATENKEILTPQVTKCAGCNQEEKVQGAFKSCAKCREVYYCGKACQKGHFKKHKKTCCKSDSRKSLLVSKETGLNLIQG